MKKEDYYNELNKGFAWLLALWLSILLVFCLSGCKTKYVSVPEYHMEYVGKEVHDTLKEYLFQKDSVAYYVKGDTVYRDRWRILYKDRCNTVSKTDTLIRVDSVRVPYPVERRLTRWERVQMDVGAVALLVLAACAVMLLVWGILRLKRKVV